MAHRSDGPNTPEYKALRKYSPQLSKAIASGADLDWFAQELHSAGLIPAAKVEIPMGLRKSQVVAGFMQSVMGQVELASKNFHKLITIMKKEEALSTAVNGLWDTYREYNPEAAPRETVASTSQQPDLHSAMTEADKELNVDKDLADLENDLYGVAGDWDRLGLKLGVPQGHLDIIKADYSDALRRLQRVLIYFINNVNNPTRRKIAKALQKMNQKNLAKKMLGDKTDGCHSDDQTTSSAGLHYRGHSTPLTREKLNVASQPPGPQPTPGQRWKIVLIIVVIGVVIAVPFFVSVEYLLKTVRSERDPSSVAPPTVTRSTPAPPNTGTVSSNPPHGNPGCAEVNRAVVQYLKDATKNTPILQGDWEQFAENLGLGGEIGNIQNDFDLRTPDKRLRKVIDLWYERSHPLKHFICALYKIEVNRNADDIARKYCGPQANRETLCSSES